MTLGAWHEEPISKTHDREAFDCGEVTLNGFLRRHARKAHDLGGAKTFLAIDDADNKTILGFYSLSPAAVQYARTPEILKRGLARHDVPGFRLAHLAVHRELQGQGLGGQLLLAAGKRCLLAASEVGGVVMVIDAKNERGAGWYAGYGAVPLMDAPLSLLLPLPTIEAALKRELVMTAQLFLYATLLSLFRATLPGQITAVLANLALLPLGIHDCGAASKPSQPLMGVTLRCKAACFGCPQSSRTVSGAS